MRWKRPARRSGTVAAILFLAGLPWAGTAQAATAPAGKVIFSSFDNAKASDIYSINPDGSGLKNLTNTPGESEQWPTFSRDGSEIVFRRGLDPVSQMELYTMDANGARVTRVTNDGFAEESPAWTPDGKQIVFSANANDPDPNCLYPPCNWDIFIMRADGTHVRQLTFGPDGELFPQVSPDGRKILFTRFVGLGDSAIYIMNIDGTGVTRIGTPPALLAGNGHWSPDGTRIAIADNSCLQCPASDIWTMNPDGSALVRVTSNNQNELPGGWSPDGRWIVLTQRAFAPNSDIVRIRPDGTGLTTLTQQVHGGGFEPSWAPG
jgi:Tol biopolymer transport system component